MTIVFPMKCNICGVELATALPHTCGRPMLLEEYPTFVCYNCACKDEYAMKLRIKWEEFTISLT